jgi:tRNA/tmRNA/rRNA uracil-C5-methylase (TrmA/RlmC/RlmD family)
VRTGDVAAELGRLAPADVAVLDPPRAGAGAAVSAALAGLVGRRVVYVSCDPATLARDLATFTGAGWKLAGLRAFDLFPMTEHVECVAVLDRA